MASFSSATNSCHCYSSLTSCQISCALYLNLQLPLPLKIPNASETSIRLVCIKAGSENDTLECSMFTASLAEKSRFTALSYVWGDATTRHPILVNGCTISIAGNLHSALKHLRSPTSHIVLWADAICIDQTNLAERGHQVEQMPKVYGAAEEVVAWLGEADDNSDAAMDYIATCGSRKNKIAKKSDATRLTFEIQAALNKLWSRAYWTRAWVVQELASARRSRKRCTFRCGNWTVSYNVLRNFMTSFLRNVLFTGSDAVLKPKRMLTLSSSASHMPFLEVLWESALLQSTDPRDRIYGIRGISPQFYRDTIKADYSLEFPRLCSKFMTHHIKKERSLNILCCFAKFPSPSRYPSWSCDLRNRTSGISPFAYWASGERSAAASIINGILHAKGIRISVVENMSGPYHIPPLCPPSGIYPCLFTSPLALNDMKNIAKTALQSRYPEENEDIREDRFWHMVAGGQHNSWGAGGSQFQAPCQEVWSRCSLPEISAFGVTWEARRNFECIFEPMLDRCFFTTVDHHIGLGPPDLQIGDVVCVLYGCSLCIILRHIDAGYNFVGAAYVDGAMSGEYVRAEGSEGSEGPREMKFSIR